jgi:hypothetical protein
MHPFTNTSLSLSLGFNTPIPRHSLKALITMYLIVEITLLCKPQIRSPWIPQGNEIAGVAG